MKKKQRIWIPAVIPALLLGALIVSRFINMSRAGEPFAGSLPPGTTETLADAEKAAKSAAAQADDGVSPQDSDNTDAPDAGSTNTPDPGSADAPDADSVTLTCRIVSGAKTGDLLLAAQDGSAGVYRLNVSDYPLTYENSETAGLQNGMLLAITHGGIILETYPAQFGDVREILVPDSGMDNLCELYLKVLDDLWEVDPALNADITELGVDLSSTRLSESEQAAVALSFGEAHGLFPIQGTYRELAEQGYINQEQLYWENGCLFSITEQDLQSVEESGNSGTSSPVPGAQKTLTFNAQKWRSGTGAYFFTDCTSIRSASGTWDSYTVGGHAIS